MALSDKNQNHTLDSGPHRQPRPLWSRIVATTRTSLVFNDEVATVTPEGITQIKSLVFRVGRSTDSIMFDVTSRPETQKDFFRIIAQQFPGRWGVAFHMEGNRKIIEVSFLEAVKKEQALATGMLFTQDKICIFPTHALAAEARIVRLSLTHLPLDKEDDILFGLRHSLKGYGKILDVGISREKEYNTYVGQGYAVLDTYQTEDAEIKYDPLTHNIA